MIHGQFAYAAGTSGTATIPLGASIISVRAQSQAANGTLTIFGGTAIPVVGVAALVPGVLDLEFRPGDVMTKTGSQDLVFANTVSFLVAYLLAPGQG